jgi:hypothetical protein
MDAKALSGRFPAASVRLEELKTAGSFLRKVLNVWETNALYATAPDQRQRESLERLDAFVARRWAGRAEDLLASMDAFEAAIRAGLNASLAITQTARAAATAAADDRA